MSPERDYNSGAGVVCPLLSRLLGPGGPLLDIQLVVSPAAFDFTFRRARLDTTSFSRCDLALGNLAALGLVSQVYVEPGVMDGGHSPVVVELRDHSAWGLCWKRPRRQLPALQSPSAPPEDAKKLLEDWGCSPEVQRFVHRQTGETVQGLSSLMDLALQHLVGWDGLDGSSNLPVTGRPASPTLAGSFAGSCSAWVGALLCFGALRCRARSPFSWFACSGTYSILALQRPLLYFGRTSPNG